MNPED